VLDRFESQEKSLIRVFDFGILVRRGCQRSAYLGELSVYRG
jgi:hypothetical protein